MSDVVEELLQQVREHNAGNEPAAEATAEPVAPPVEAAPEPEKPRFSLDDVIIDDPRLPDELRGKPASVLFEDRTKGWHEAHQRGYQKNRLEAERDTAMAVLEKLAKQIAEREQPKAEPKTVTPMDRFRGYGTEPIDVLSDAEKALSTTIRVATDEAESRINPAIVKLQEKLEALEAERQQERTAREHERYRQAFLAARPEGVSPEMWESDYSGPISSYLILNQLPLDDPKSYKQAGAWLEDFVARRTGSSAAPTTPPAPAAPAPPVGGKPAPVQTSKPSAHLNNHQRAAYSSVTDVFNRIGLNLTVDDVLNDAKSDPKLKGLFP